MKVLLTLARPLFPPDSGGKIRSLNIFSRLAERAEIHAVSLAHPTEDAEPIRQMKDLFASYTPVFWHEVPKFSPRFYLDLGLSRFSRFPYFLGKYRVPELRQAAERVAAEQGCDVLLCDFLQSAVAMLESPLRPRVIFQHNVEYVIRRRHWEVESHPVKKAVWSAEWRKARAIEEEVCREFDHVLAVSDDDEQRMRREFGCERVTVLPTGVDTDYFRPQQVPARPGNIAFVGSMDWQPNEDGIFWFAREVFPLVRQRVSNATLTVIGKKPSPRIRALASDAIEITGTVDDVRPYLARAEAVIVPLLVGGGTRIKIFEAMAMGRAVISTGLGAEGLGLVSGREIVLSDAADEFAKETARLLSDASLRERIGRTAHDLVRREHTWDAAVDRLEEILQTCIRRFSTADADQHPVVARGVEG